MCSNSWKPIWISIACSDPVSSAERGRITACFIPKIRKKGWTKRPFAIRPANTARRLLGMELRFEQGNLLLREIDQMKRMGMGGFHMHVRTGMSTTYSPTGLCSSFVTAWIRPKERMRAYLYDEDRWASGRGGRLCDQGERYRARYLLFTTVSYEQAENPASVPVDSPRTGKGRLLARYAVRLNDEGELAEYRLLKDGQQADAAETAWYAYLEIESGIALVQQPDLCQHAGQKKKKGHRALCGNHA